MPGIIPDTDAVNFSVVEPIVLTVAAVVALILVELSYA